MKGNRMFLRYIVAVLLYALSFNAFALTWNVQGDYAYGFNSVFCLNSQQVWAVGDNGRIVHTNNGGLSWEYQPNGYNGNLNDVCFTDSLHGWAVGGSDGNFRNMLVTTNGGDDWTILNPLCYQYLNSVTFIDSLTGWVLGSYSTGDAVSLHTIDGGLTWTTQAEWGFDHWWWGLTFCDPNHGWAVGNYYSWPYTSYYYIYRTTNGGANWQQIQTSEQMQSIYFINPDVGWLVGPNGSILHSTDGGDTWTPQTSGTTEALYKVVFSDSQHGWACGSRGIILYTSDGGNVWSVQRIGGESEYLSDMAFTTNYEGWAVGNGYILHTQNGTPAIDETLTTPVSAQFNLLNAPNPANPKTTFSYGLPKSGQTELNIYNIRGQLVRKLVNEPLTSGQHTVTWDGKDDSGKALASGMYLCRISFAGKQETHKMLLMK